MASPTPQSAAPRAYAYLDRSAGKTGQRYYRLRQLDLDGGSSLSPVRALGFGAGEPLGASLAVAPNPVATGEPAALWVQLPTAAAGPARLWLSDALGRTVRQTQLPALPAGASELPLSDWLQGLPTGVYELRLQAGGHTLHAKFGAQ